MVEETKEFKFVKDITKKGWETGKKLWSVPIGSAGLMLWSAALITALNQTFGALVCFGFGLVLIVKAKKELKAKEESK